MLFASELIAQATPDDIHRVLGIVIILGEVIVQVFGPYENVLYKLVFESCASGPAKLVRV